MVGRLKKFIKDKSTIRDLYRVVKYARKRDYKKALHILSKNEKAKDFVMKHQNLIFIFLKKYKPEIMLMRKLYEIHKNLESVYPD